MIAADDRLRSALTALLQEAGGSGVSGITP
jgi:hypothetical protein